MLAFTDSRPASPGPADGRPALVMSHSFSFAKREWIEVAGLVADQYRTVAIDMPGFGASHDVTGYSMEEMSRQFAAVIAELELERIVLVGHSMSGKIMQILASRMGPALGLPRPPEKLLLVTPTPLGKEVGGEEMKKVLLAAQKNRWDAEKFVATHTGTPLPDAVKERAMQDYLQSDRRGYEAWLNEGVYEDWIDRASPVDVETLVVVAERDPTWGIETQRKLTLPHLPNARTVMVDTGHSVPMEAPEQLAATIRDFVGL